MPIIGVRSMQFSIDILSQQLPNKKLEQRDMIGDIAFCCTAAIYYTVACTQQPKSDFQRTETQITERILLQEISQ